MIPPIPSKQWLGIRTIATIVFDKIAEETAESNMLVLPQIIPFPTPANTLYALILAYYAYSYYRAHYTDVPFRKREKITQFDKYVLSENGYYFIKMGLVVLFLLIRDPKPVV